MNQASTHKQNMEDVYNDDIYAYLGLQYCHLGYWHETNASDFHRAQEDFLAEVIEPIPITPSDTILDVGGGNGATAIWLAKRYGCKIVAVDIVENNITLANAAIKDAHLEHQVVALCQDAMTLEFENNYFDHIISIGALHHFDHKQQLFTLFGKILKPGGQLACSVYHCSLTLPVIREIYLDLTVASRHLDSLDVYIRTLTGAGFQNIRTRDISDKTLLKSSKLLVSEPYYSRIEQYGKRHYGHVSTKVLLPLLKYVHFYIVNTHRLSLDIIHAEKPGS